MPSSDETCFDPVTASGRSPPGLLSCTPKCRNREADVDGAPPIGGKPSTDALIENFDEADVDGAPPIGGKPSTDALLSAESARLPLALALFMRPLAAKLLLRLDSSAKSGSVFTQHVLSERASTLLVSRFHFRLSYFHLAC